VPTPANTFLSRIDTLPIYSWSSSREGATAAIIIIITFTTTRRPHHYLMATLSREEFSSVSLFTSSTYKRNQSSLLHGELSQPQQQPQHDIFIVSLVNHYYYCGITLLLTSFNDIQFEKNTGGGGGGGGGGHVITLLTAAFLSNVSH
jgi:hypothetical protein